MNLITCVCLSLATWPNVFAMYHIGSKEVFQPPAHRHLRNDSYFGYSVTYDEFNKKLVASAPRESDIGEVYTCNIKSRECTPIVRENVKRWYHQYRHDYWFGATVKAGRDFVMMCAPRYTVHWNSTDYATNGNCYSYTKNGDLKERKRILKTDRCRGLPKIPSVEKTMDSFGWSIDIARDNSTIVGGPGMYHGRAMIYNQPAIYKVPNIIGKAKNSSEFNFGYAVASGEFINEDLSYAVSSPYGIQGHGEVLFYRVSGVFQLRRLKENPSQVGSLFGAVLCAARLLDDRTDLLVGAPAYAVKDTYNRGAVYVYLTRKLTEAPSFHRRIVGEVSGSMFGSAIVSVGDLNGDEKDEIAIGAPFEKEGHGIVYLYSGADLISEVSERDLKCLQRIEPATSYGESFGMSLTPLLDYDKNGCNELAIGSPYKDTVLILRCMAAVIVETSVKFPNLQIRNSSKTNFDFEVCLSVKYPNLPKEIIALLSTTVEMDHISAKLVNTNGTGHFTYITSLDDKRPKYCKTASFILPSDGKYETKISYTISSKLLNDPRTLRDFNTSRVILSDRSTLNKRGSVWAAECAGAVNETCVPNLTLTPYFSFHNTDDPYIIGSSKTETMSITVNNDGEVAYDPCVRIQFVGANVLTIPSGCVHDGPPDANSLMCEPSKPIRTNKTWTSGKIVLEMTHLTNLDRIIMSSMFLFDRCEDNFTQNITETIPVKADPRGITTKGETDIGTIVNMTKEDIEQNGKKMQHVYTITNKGPTNWKMLRVQVTLQTKPYIKYGDIPVTVYFSTSNLYPACPFLSEDETSMTYVCEIESLMKMIEFAKILIPMYIVPGTLVGKLDEDKNVTIKTSVKLQFFDDNYNVESVTTTLTLQDAMVPIEFIIIAVVVGLCIIIIIALILYRVGFLRRKKREELNKLKKSVKRQTILRRSTMPSHAPPAEDRRQILEDMKEQNETDDIQDSKEK